MILSNRNGLKNTRNMLRVFGGLNETYSCTEAEYSAGINFSARNFPALSTRLPRRKLREEADLNGMYHLNGLLTVCGRDLVYTPDDADEMKVTLKDAVEDGRKTLVGIGTRILIFPDKLAFDTASRKVSALGAVWSGKNTSVEFAPCDAEGKVYEVSGCGPAEPDKPTDGQLFLRVEDPEKPWSSESTLEVYSKASGNWSAVVLDYCRISAKGVGTDFAAEDTVTLTGSAAEQAGQWNELDGDRIMAVCAAHMKKQGKLRGGAFVATILSNMGLHAYAEKNGMKIECSNVGDRYVLEMMLKKGYILGGEQSGHIIFSKYAVTGDGVLTSLMLMEVMLEKKAKLSELRKDLKVYPQLLKNVRVADKPAAREDKDVQAAVKKVADELGDEGRILLRESGTEPVIRVMVEASSDELCKKYVDEVVDVLYAKGHGILGGSR